MNFYEIPMEQQRYGTKVLVAVNSVLHHIRTAVVAAEAACETLIFPLNGNPYFGKGRMVLVVAVVVH